MDAANMRLRRITSADVAARMRSQSCVTIGGLRAVTDRDNRRFDATLLIATSCNPTSTYVPHPWVARGLQCAAVRPDNFTRANGPGEKMVQFWKALSSDERGRVLAEYALVIELLFVALMLIAIGIASGVLVR